MKLALLVRTDLGMSRGKIAAQVAHAAVTAALAGAGQPSLRAWLEVGQPKVVLRVPDGDRLAELAAAARAAGLPVAVVRDAGRTQVPPGTPTCAAIGPADGVRVDAVVGDLPLL